MSASSPLVASSATASRVAPPRSAARRRRRREREGGARPRTTTRATFVVDSAAAASSISDDAPIAPTVAPIAPAKGAGSASQLLQDATTVDTILDAANALTLPNEERLHWHSQRIHRKKRQRAATLALTRLAKWLAPLEALATHGERERCVNDARFARLVDAAAAQFWDDDFFREVGDDDDDDDDGGSGSERPLSAADLADALIDRDNAAEALRALASLAPLTDALRHKPKCDVAVRLLAARVVAETETTPLPAHVATAMDWAFGRVLF